MPLGIARQVTRTSSPLFRVALLHLHQPQPREIARQILAGLLVLGDGGAGDREHAHHGDDVALLHQLLLRHRRRQRRARALRAEAQIPEHKARPSAKFHQSTPFQCQSTIRPMPMMPSMTAHQGMYHCGIGQARDSRDCDGRRPKPHARDTAGMNHGADADADAARPRRDNPVTLNSICCWKFEPIMTAKPK